MPTSHKQTHPVEATAIHKRCRSNLNVLVAQDVYMLPARADSTNRSPNRNRKAEHSPEALYNMVFFPKYLQYESLEPQGNSGCLLLRAPRFDL